MRIERRGGSPSGDELALLLVQRDSGSEGGRRFGLRLGETGQPDRLRGEFAPLEDGERAQRRCAMDFRLGPEGLVGETDPQSCRFGDGEQSVGLLKEIAFDGRDLRIGDRLVHPASGEPRGEDRIVHFLPAVDYDGWAGRRDGDGWRVAREFTIRAGQDPERLVDAAGMELGFSAELRYYRIQRQDSPVLLRLTIRDADTGETLAEGWSEPGARTIGLALPDFQVGLRLAR